MAKALKFVFSAISLLIVLFFVSLLRAEPLTIVGTGDGTHVLRAIAKEYTADFPKQVILIPKSVGSSGGIRLVGKRKKILGRVARKIKKFEEHYGLTYIPYARIPVVFYVNPTVDITQLSIKQVLNIYRGIAQNWSAFGGASEKIRVVRRERGDSSLELLNRKIKTFEKIQFGEFIKVATSEKQSVILVASTVGAIGFGPLPDSGGPNVKILSLEGKYPTDTEYLLELVLAMVFHDENYTGEIERFIHFITSERGNEVILSSNALPY